MPTFQPQNNAPDTIYDTPGLSERLGTTSGSKPSPRTIERWRIEGNGPRYVKLGRRVVYREADVDQWLRSQTRSFTGESRRRA